MSAPLHIAAERAAWLRALAADPGVKLTALRVGIVIAEHVNSETREAWPSQVTIATILNDDRGNVSRGLAQLVKLGHLEVELVGRSNRYRMRLENSVPRYTHSGDTTPQTVIKKRVDLAEESVCPDTRDPCATAHPILEDIGGIIEGAAPEGARAPITEQSALYLHSNEQAGAPDGARPDRLEFEAEIIFGRPLGRDQLTQFRKLVSTLGREDLGQRLANYRHGVEAGIIAPLPFAKWLRQGGLVGVANVA